MMLILMLGGETPAVKESMGLEILIYTPPALGKGLGVHSIISVIHLRPQRDLRLKRSAMHLPHVHAAIGLMAQNNIKILGPPLWNTGPFRRTLKSKS